MSIGLILLIVLIAILLGGLPTVGYGYGHGVTGGIGLLLLIVLVLLLIGRL
jgi:hypothetical protein